MTARSPKFAHAGLLLSVAAIGVWLFGMADAQARSCADLYRAIKIEAMGCGFICDQARLKPLQEAYSATCIPVVLPLAPFDLDSIPQEPVLVAGHSGLDAEATLPVSAR
jgi:hypothetical protein